jgi:hypothetical protein
METKITKSDLKNIKLSSYRYEEINTILLNAQKNSELLILYIDYIRNYIELTDKMMENIKHFDDESKMLLIKEYNKVIKVINNLLE